MTSVNFIVAAVLLVAMMSSALGISSALRGSSGESFSTIRSYMASADDDDLDEEDEEEPWRSNAAQEPGSTSTTTTFQPPNTAALEDEGFELGVRQDVYFIPCAQFAGVYETGRKMDGMLDDMTPFATRVAALINFTTIDELFLTLDYNRSECRAVNFIGKIMIERPGNYTFILKGFGRSFFEASRGNHCEQVEYFGNIRVWQLHGEQSRQPVDECNKLHPRA